MLLTRLSSQVDFPWSLPINQRFTLVSEFSAVSGCWETLKSLFTRWVQILLCFCIFVSREVYDIFKHQKVVNYHLVASFFGLDSPRKRKRLEKRVLMCFLDHLKCQAGCFPLTWFSYTFCEFRPIRVKALPIDGIYFHKGWLPLRDNLDQKPKRHYSLDQM